MDLRELNDSSGDAAEVASIDAWISSSSSENDDAKSSGGTASWTMGDGRRLSVPSGTDFQLYSDCFACCGFPVEASPFPLFLLFLRKTRCIRKADWIRIAWGWRKTCPRTASSSTFSCTVRLSSGTMRSASTNSRSVKRIMDPGHDKSAPSSWSWITRSREKDTETQYALEELRNELSGDYEHDTQQLRDALRNEMEVRLKELETRLLNEQDEAITQVQEDSEKLIEKVELAMTQLKTQKDAMEKELVKLRSALEEAEDSHFDVEEQMKKQCKQMTFRFLALLMQARKRIEDDKLAHTSAVMEFQAKQDSLENDRAREKKKWNDEITQIRAVWSQMQLKHDEMLKTLTNCKRDELVVHRSASGVLSNEISIVTKQMDEVHEMKASLEREIEQLQGEAQQVEANLRQLMVQNSSSSAESSSNNGSSGGSLNMAVVAKKRRLNEEFEALLEQMEKKEAEVRNVETTFAALRSRREAKEQEMKVMERELVEILVQQQKHMLALLTSIRELAVPAPLTASA